MYKDYYYDKELGMYNINNRFYLPDINRFLIPDSVGNIDIKDIGNLNLYTYSNNNPINGCYKDKLDESKPSNSTINTITPSRTVLIPKVIYTNSFLGLTIYDIPNLLNISSIIMATINSERLLNGLEEIKILNKIDNYLQVLEIFNSLFTSIYNNFTTNNLPIECKIGFSLSDVLYFGTEGFIIFASEKAASYFGFLSPLLGVYLSNSFIDLFEKRWDKKNCDKYYGMYFTTKVRIIFEFLKYYKPILL